MSAEAITPVPGYEQYFGSKKFFVGEITGPSVYATGGQTLDAKSLGWGGFDRVSTPMLSISGTYYARVQQLPIDAAPSVPAKCTKTVKIIWYVLATNAEVAAAVDLSTEVIKFEALGV